MPILIPTGRGGGGYRGGGYRDDRRGDYRDDRRGDYRPRGGYRGDRYDGEGWKRARAAVALSSHMLLFVPPYVCLTNYFLHTSP